MKVGTPQAQLVDSAVVVSAPVSDGASSFRAEFRAPPGSLADRSDPFLTAALIPAMKLGEPLDIEGPVSARLYSALPTIQDIYCSWDLGLSRIPVRAEVKDGGSSHPHRGVAAFFSGGVDSFYTVLKHRAEIDTLVLIHGFDMPFEDRNVLAGTARALEQAAAELGKQFLVVETNIQPFITRHLHWRYSHGVVLGSAAQFLSPLFRRIYVASSASYADLEPAGSHPLLDPLWTTEEMVLVHDGCEYNKMQKIPIVAACDTAWHHLRVCLVNGGAAVNCGRCYKCVRTMIGLEHAGVLERCTTFAQPLTPEVIADCDVSGVQAGYLLTETLRDVQRRDGNPQIEQALRAAITRAGIQAKERRDSAQADMDRTLASTQKWAKEMQALALSQQRELELLNRSLLVRIARRLSK